MKAVPRVNIDGLYMEVTIVDDAFYGVVPFYADPPEPELPPETDIETVEPEEETEPEIAGYIVGVPVPPGLYLPRFDLARWEEYQKDVTAAQEVYRLQEDELEAVYHAEMAQWLAQPPEDRDDEPMYKPPVYSAPKQPELWTEGLTAEEIEELTKPQPEEPSELDQLKQDVTGLKQDTADLASGLDQVARKADDRLEDVSTIGSEQVKQDLATLDLKRQSTVIGGELVKKDIAILDLYQQNQALGQMLAALELKILAGGESNV
ncbi:hypothetical protein DMN77_23220 [Paenibacillus sp. 79R4]|uniref:hypothetical protein n=1 Tax=Paenibacillus sp. 79R4 TaxID=2212847 RepID=UPI0015B9588A|nr:hypothetical protein [Paenibacillus sp. 79R4]NWL90466.1 hypothetical protein [Paenibacillus sp. 79R4]